MKVPEATLRMIFSTQLGLPEAHFQPEQRLHEDLGADSLDIIELVMAMEEEFRVEITDEEAIGAKTFGALLALVESKVQP